MNTKLIKSAFIAVLLSLVLSFSSFAMELPTEPVEFPPEVLPPEKFEELGMRACLGWVERLEINNATNAPIFITVLGENERSFRLLAGLAGQYDITDDWSFHNPASTPYRPEVFEFTLSTAAGAEPIGTVKFLMNNDETDLKVELNIGSYYKIDFYDVDERGHLLFNIRLADDNTKPAGNFEHTIFELKEGKYEGGVWITPTISPESVNEQELRKRALERQRARFFEHERLLERPEIIEILEKQKEELPMFKRK